MIQVCKVILYKISLQLKQPFATSQGVYQARETLIVELQTKDGLSGFGECEAFANPWYTEETLDTEMAILQKELIPIVLSQSFVDPYEAAQAFRFIKRNHFAKAGLEMALWDLYSQQQNQSISTLIGATRSKIDVGVALGVPHHIEELYKQIEHYQAFGYKRFKIKIKRGFDIQVVEAIRSKYPNLPLMVDANSAYTLDDAEHLQQLDAYNLMMIEQPLSAEDIYEHAILQKQLKTPICLDESIHTLEDAKLAIALHSCQIMNVKLGRVGGLTEALRIHKLCSEHNMAVWVGGMLESGVGRAHHIALAACSQFTIPGDISASSKYWSKDIICPEVEVINGQITVPSSPGLGFNVDRAYLEELAIEKKEYVRERQL